ncbi:Ser/Thr protein phosphatase superfamily [Xylaria bambusicola]|uniref:Ser/Thr protein phosphatase superfamily n=1 Tax=Xylaria bambusicola TaxID=326684 RepID=UPI0020076E6E|nr:Ser/Thr protein phosphatase superfamily [Xylaria bambusicola]KAI0505775.1 Ser/Thr protein phosphatase superfamily [Xylaria bambusicola]
MVAIQILSDLHLEGSETYNTFDIPAKAPYLALLGDIGYASKHGSEYCDFLRRQLAKFRVVFLVLGNHEPWYSNWDKTRQLMRAFEQTIRSQRETAGAKQCGEFVLLDRTRYDIPASESEGEPGLTILGCTLFSRVPPESMRDVSRSLGDFGIIRNWFIEDHSAQFEEELAWLNSQVDALSKEDKKIVIFTHYSPTTDDRAVDPRHRNSSVQSGFVTDLREEGCWMSPNVKMWAFGHTHFNCDFVDGHKRVLAHQRGYSLGQADAFEVGKVFDI